MTSVAKQFSDITKSQVDAAVRIATIAAAGSEKIIELQINNTRTAFSEGVKTAKTLAEVKDVSQLPSWTSATPQAGIESATAYMRSLYEVAAGTQAEISAVLEEQATAFNKSVTAAIEAALASAPAGSESMVSAFKSAMGTANSMYEGFTKATKQMTTLAESNLAAATSTAHSTGSKKKAAA